MPPVRATVLPTRHAIARRVTSLPTKELRLRIEAANEALQTYHAELGVELLALGAAMAIAVSEEDEARLRAKLHEFRGLAGTSGAQGAREVARALHAFLDTCRERKIEPRWDVVATHVQTIIAMQKLDASAAEAGEHLDGLAQATRRALA